MAEFTINLTKTKKEPEQILDNVMKMKKQLDALECVKEQIDLGEASRDIKHSIGKISRSLSEQKSDMKAMGNILNEIIYTYEDVESALIGEKRLVNVINTNSKPKNKKVVKTELKRIVMPESIVGKKKVVKAELKRIATPELIVGNRTWVDKKRIKTLVRIEPNPGSKKVIQGKVIQGKIIQGKVIQVKSK